MSQTNLPIKPDEATKALLTNLPSRRMRDVLKKRFGLQGGRRFTLEAIGKDYKITRERVRQIEADALKHLHKPENLRGLEQLWGTLEEHVEKHGGVMSEDHLMASLVEASYRPHVSLLLGVSPAFSQVEETDHCQQRWTINKEDALRVEKIMAGAVRDLEKEQRPVSRAALYGLIARHAKEITGEIPPEHILDAYLKTSKVIRENPYGEYGLAHWSDISPRGVRDKAYLVLAKIAKPLHFREVAEAINKVGWSKRRAHPQTVHNELIKDKRFVLVGRGLYALKEWGYEPGTVGDVIRTVLKHAGRPLSKEEIIKLVLDKRMVKTPTILLNLQNKSLFRRNDEGKYTLV